MFVELKYWAEFAELAERTWYDKKRLPNKTEYKKCLVEMGGNPDRVDFLLTHDHFEKILRERGLIRDPEDDTLLPEQYHAIGAYLNITDQRTWRAKLADLGITPTQWNAWLKYPPFREYLQKRADELYAEGLPMAHKALLEQVSRGNVRAIKLYYDTYGFGQDKQAGNTQDVRLLVTRLVEVIQRHVTDQPVLQAIARDFEVVVNGGMPMIRGEIERADDN